MATKLKKNLKSLKILSETIRPKDTKFGMSLYLMGLYQVFSNNIPGVKFESTLGVTSFTWTYKRENFRNLPVLSHKAWDYHIVHVA